ncbi:restriction endonuclease subunit S [Streptomyces phaeochromogenes]
MGDLILGEALDLLIDNRGKNPPYVADGIPVISAKAVKRGVILMEEARQISEDTYRRWMPNELQVNDVILTSEAPLGECALVTYERPLAIAQRLYGMRGKPGILDGKYLYYAFKAHSVQADLHSRSSGSTVAGIRQPELLKVRIPDPGYAVQLAIAEVLGALDDKIAVNERIAVTASELAAVHYLATHERELVKIADVANVTMGQSPPGETFNEQGNGLPFYQGNRDFGFRFPGYRVWCTAVTRQAGVNDVLVSVRAPVGQINVATELCGIGRGLASVRSEKYPHVLLQALSADGSIWLPYEAEGTVFGSINKKQFTQLEIGWPTAEFINSLESRLSKLDQRIRRATEESRTLAALRDTLLPQLMSGKLRVRDAEKIVEDAV